MRRRPGACHKTFSLTKSVKLSPSAAGRGFASVLVPLALVAVSAFGLDTSKLKPRGYVNDFASALDAPGAQRLEAYCTQLQTATGAQLAVVIVPTLDGEPIEDAS